MTVAGRHCLSLEISFQCAFALCRLLYVCLALQKAQMLKRARSELQEKEEEVEKPIDVHLNMAETEVSQMLELV